MKNNSIKNKILTLSILIFSFLIINSYAAQNPKKIVDIQTWPATHGTKVYFVYSKEIPMVDIQIVFAAGSAYDGTHWGLATVVNNMLDEGTENQTANQIAETFDKVGAEFNNDVDRDMALVRLRSLSAEKYLNPALNEFVTIISQSNFPENSLERIKNQTLIAIKRDQQNPSTIADNAFYQSVYGDQPYGHPVIGTTNSVENINREALENFYKKYYVAQNADIIIVGDITSEQAKAIGNLIGKSLPIGQPAKLDLVKPDNKSIFTKIDFPTKQTMIVMGQLGITRENPHYFPLMVGNAILGGLPFISNLFQQVRVQRGLTYDVNSSFDSMRDRGVFAIRLKTKSSETTQTLELVRGVLQKFVEQGPTEQELKAAKDSIIGSFPLNLASNDNILSIVTNMAFYHRPLDFLDLYRTKIAAVTLAQIKQAFRELIDPARLVVITVGPVQERGERIRNRGT